MKKLHKSRTVWLGVGVSTFSVIQGLVLSAKIDPIIQGVVGVVLGAVIVFLRLDTDGPIE